MIIKQWIWYCKWHGDSSDDGWSVYETVMGEGMMLLKEIGTDVLHCYQ